MTHKIRQCVIGGFALWLVALSGITYPQLTAHISQHAHHNKAAHATVLCSWLCIAADAVEGTSVHVAPMVQVTLLEQKFFVPQINPVLTVRPPSRAPPFA